MFNKINPITRTIVILLAIVALMAGLLLSQHVHKKKVDISQLHGTLLDKPRSLPSFSLLGTDHKPFDNARLNGSWTFIFFGFTNCGYLCPTTMAELGKMYRLLDKNQVQPMPQVVMISLDPARDDLDKLKHYVKAFDGHFYGARGSDDVIKALTNDLGVAYFNVMPKADDVSKTDSIDHSGAIMLVNPQGHLVAFFTTPHDAEWLAKDYQRLVA